ncbi:MAG: sigma-70 family RNA polymerase sigma factor [Aeriscardovia sp.]|nr:sigma-70 family RNA polymerase sigma factor [Aeriscardovia sp.]
MEDQQIIKLFWDREEQAVKETAYKYSAYCYAIAFNVLSVKEDAEECVNDTLQKAWDSIPPNRPDNLKAWLGKVCRNVALNLWQKNHAKKRNRGMDLLLSELEECIPSSNTVEKEIENSEISMCINRWLRTLSREDRILFVRRYWYGDAVKALAKARGTSSQTITQRLFRLRKGLKAALEKEDIQL